MIWLHYASFCLDRQAVPGPLFTLAAYLGAVMGGWPIAMMTIIAIFLPSFLLVIGVVPFWDKLRIRPDLQSLWAINAAVVGILIAALYDPVWTSAIRTPADFLDCSSFGAYPPGA